MSSETALTGRLGKLVVDDTLVARLTKWTVNPALSGVSEWGDSDSGGYTNRAAQRFDGKFTVEGKFDTTSEVWDLFQEGDVVEAVLWLNTVLYWDFPRALCTGFSLVVDVDTQEVIGWTADFGADGIFYYPGMAGAPSQILP